MVKTVQICKTSHSCLSLRKISLPITVSKVRKMEKKVNIMLLGKEEVHEKNIGDIDW